MTDRLARIGGASGFWGDTDLGAHQLVRSGLVDYVTFDYLAEITMSLLSRARAKDPDAGFIPDFVKNVVAPLAKDIQKRGVRLLANAGGVNPIACKKAIETVLAEAGVSLTVAAVTGDDLMNLAGDLRQEGVVEMFSGAPFPEKPWSINAYLGAPAIAQALAAEADIVVTGRCADSALVLGVLMHEFGWDIDDWDRLAAGSLAGHIVECGAQATGGLFTDWREIADGWDDMGFPIVECMGDGSFVVTKPPETGGAVNVRTVAEQIVYEIGDPSAYLLPDVTCDFSNVRLTQDGPDRVKVAGASGRAATGTYKVSATWQDGFRSLTTVMVGGIEAAEKAQKVADAILSRTRRRFRDRNLGDYTETSIEVLGAEATYGAHARTAQSREVILKIAVRHPDKAALDIFAREIAPAATAMSPGLTGFAGGRPRATPMVRLFSFLIDKSRVSVQMQVGDRERAAEIATAGQPDSGVELLEGTVEKPPAGSPTVPLIALAHGRSGDKGDKANIGILARDPAFLPVIRAALNADAVRDYMSHAVAGAVERFEWPGLDGLNFVLDQALGGGGTASLRYDPQGKAFAQMLLDFPVPVPAEWLTQGGPLSSWQAAKSKISAA